MKTDSTVLKRNSSIELLRIIAVLMVITVHYLDASGGGILAERFVPDFNHSIARIIESLAIIGVNLFVLISGYFGVNQNGINLKRVLGIITLVAFWGLLIYFHNIASGEKFSILGVVKALFPYLFGEMWYIRVYLMLLILTPFINVMLNNLRVRAFTSLFIIILILFSILPSFLPAFKNTYGYDIVHFVMVYCIGAYLKNGIKRMPPKYLCLVAYFVFSAITTAFSVFGDGLPYWGYDFITNVLSSLALFMFFAQFSLFSRIINYVAGSVLGIYVLNISFPNLYTKFVIRENYFDSRLFIIHLLCSVLGFFILAFL